MATAIVERTDGCADIAKDQEHKCHRCGAPDRTTVYRFAPVENAPLTYMLLDSRKIIDASTGKELGVYPEGQKLLKGRYKRIVLSDAYLPDDSNPHPVSICQPCQAWSNADVISKMLEQEKRLRDEQRAQKAAAERKRRDEERQRVAAAARIAEFGPLLFPEISNA